MHWQEKTGTLQKLPKGTAWGPSSLSLLRSDSGLWATPSQRTPFPTSHQENVITEGTHSTTFLARHWRCLRSWLEMVCLPISSDGAATDSFCFKFYVPTTWYCPPLCIRGTFLRVCWIQKLSTGARQNSKSNSTQALSTCRQVPEGRVNVFRTWRSTCFLPVRKKKNETSVLGDWRSRQQIEHSITVSSHSDHSVRLLQILAKQANGTAT